ncbi:hypothetical protein BDA96_02G423000 [Sorghum bicolor]|uniref:Uncharacterized protein n=1 Tax=Sorghum bicolor TaxID=4558 RepID=A0A921RT68_SORBI|nr:hypothetical protein BDA96_02G423000 [Sorghum bicolor]
MATGIGRSEGEGRRWHGEELHHGRRHVRRERGSSSGVGRSRAMAAVPASVRKGRGIAGWGGGSRGAGRSRRAQMTLGEGKERFGRGGTTRATLDGVRR